MATPLVTYVSEGVSVDYTPGSAVSAGDVVVQGELVGVAALDIAADALGALCIEGLFLWPKDVGSGDAITAGQRLYWDATNEIVTGTAGSNKGRIFAIEAAAAAIATVKAVLMP